MPYSSLYKNVMSFFVSNKSICYSGFMSQAVKVIRVLNLGIEPVGARNVGVASGGN